MTRLLVALALVAAGLAIIAAYVVRSLPGPDQDEVARVKSPDATLDAVLIETNGGATTSFGYEVYVVPAGTPKAGLRVATLSGAVRNHHAYGANLDWASTTQLHVDFLQAHSVELEQASLSVGGHAVQVTLRPGIDDPSAPAGGMFYNLNRSSLNPPAGNGSSSASR